MTVSLFSSSLWISSAIGFSFSFSIKTSCSRAAQSIPLSKADEITPNARSTSSACISTNWAECLQRSRSNVSPSARFCWSSLILERRSRAAASAASARCASLWEDRCEKNSSIAVAKVGNDKKFWFWCCFRRWGWNSNKILSACWFWVGNVGAKDFSPSFVSLQLFCWSSLGLYKMWPPLFSPEVKLSITLDPSSLKDWIKSFQDASGNV